MVDRSAASVERAFLFGPFRLLPLQRILLADGKAVRLGGRALELLIAFVERPGELIGKDELIARVWPNTFVDEGNLKVQVAALRHALGDGKDGRRFLTTVPGRGYCFVAQVTNEGAEAAPWQVGPMRQVHNLPAALTRLIGRTDVVRRLTQRVSQLRLFTIAGPGGIGKTAVALAVAEALIASYEHGVWLVDLAPIGDARLVPSALATVLGLEIRSDDPLPGLISALRDRRMLIVLDNCEHVVDGAAHLAAGVLRGVGDVHILATSREPLRVQGEHVHRLSTLESPPLSGTLTAAEAAAFPAIQLFVERATERSDDFTLDDAQLPVVAEICRKLDGIPLAIELAAARVDTLGLRGIASLLDDRLRLLTYGRRTDLAHHQTMRATLDWSYGALSETEQTVLRRLAIFAGGFTLQAAEAVIGDAGILDGTIADQIIDLIAKSLIAADVHDAEPRLRMLEITRAYALEKLADGGELAKVARRHGEYYRDLMVTAALTSGDPAPTELVAGLWHATYRPEVDNVRVALSWAFSPEGDASTAVALAAASVPLWLRLSLLSECCGWTEAAIAKLDQAGAEGTRSEMVLQSALGHALMFTKGAGSGAREALTRASELAESLADTDYQLKALAGLASICHRLQDFHGALALGRRAEAIAKDLVDPIPLATADWILGSSLHLLGEYAEALTYARRTARRTSVPAVRRAHILRLGRDSFISARCTEAIILWVQGLPDQSAQAARDILADAEVSDHPLSLCLALTWCGCVLSLRLGDLESADRAVARLKEHAERYSLSSYFATGLGFEARVLGKRGNVVAAERLLRDALDRLAQAQSETHYTAFLSSMAEALAAVGRLAESVAVADEALRRAERCAAFWWMPEALRIKGEVLLLANADTAGAEALFHRSLDLAHSQGALSWELRAATSLALLYRDQGRRREARECLAPVNGRFSEGFETADLRAAKRLLDEPI